MGLTQDEIQLLKDLDLYVKPVYSSQKELFKKDTDKYITFIQGLMNKLTPTNYNDLKIYLDQQIHEYNKLSSEDIVKISNILYHKCVNEKVNFVILYINMFYKYFNTNEFKQVLNDNINEFFENYKDLNNYFLTYKNNNKLCEDDYEEYQVKYKNEKIGLILFLSCLHSYSLLSYNQIKGICFEFANYNNEHVLIIFLKMFQNYKSLFTEDQKILFDRETIIIPKQNIYKLLNEIKNLLNKQYSKLSDKVRFDLIKSELENLKKTYD